MLWFFLLCIIIPGLLGCFFSSGAGWRWLCGLFVGVLCYGILHSILGSVFQIPGSRFDSNFYTSVWMTGSVLGATSLFALYLNAKDDEALAGYVTLGIALFYLLMHTLDFWSRLQISSTSWNLLSEASTSSTGRLAFALRYAGPGLCWSQLLIMRAVWLIREGKGWRTPPPARVPPSPTPSTPRTPSII